MNNNGWPLSRKKTVRLLVALTIVVWATQTLLSQWGRGAPVEVTSTAPSRGGFADEKFVPGTSLFAGGATIELRNEATVVGEEIRLRQVARWSKQDDAVLMPVGELVLARVNSGAPFRGITLDEIKQTLRDAGVNIAALNFVGATSCTVNRSDVRYDERIALQQWIDAKQPDVDPTTAPTTQPLAEAIPAASPTVQEENPVRSLRGLLVEDLASRLSIPPDSIQMNFKPEDQRVLNLSEPMFRFEIEPLKVRNLGEVEWLVLIVAGEEVQKAKIVATARAWQNQLVVSKPLAPKQIIRDEDLIERRTLVDRLSDDPLLTRAEAVGQQASRELKPGTVLTGRTVDAVQLVKAGQYVTITLKQGAVNIKTVARALESGSYGQTIRVKNETTKDMFQVVLTGPQTATMNLSQPQPGQGNLASTGNE